VSQNNEHCHIKIVWECTKYGYLMGTTLIRRENVRVKFSQRTDHEDPKVE
jgi:hypothetical protein